MGLDFENLYGRNTIGFIADPIKASTQQSKSTTAKGQINCSNGAQIKASFRDIRKA